VFDTAKAVWRYSGMRGFYRGLGPTVLGYLPTWAIYFAVYDGIKTTFGEAPLGSQVDERGQTRVIYPAAQTKGYQPVSREHPWTLHIASAMAAGAASTTCTNPLWVIKTRFMTQTWDEPRYLHTFDAARTIYRTEGIRAFYRGLLPSLLGITHVAVQFPLYEQLKRWARKTYLYLTFPLSPSIDPHAIVIPRKRLILTASSTNDFALLRHGQDDGVNSYLPS